MKTNIKYYGNDKAVYEKIRSCKSFDVTIQSKLSDEIKVDLATNILILHLDGNLTEQIYKIQMAKIKILNTNVQLVVLGDLKYIKEYLNQGVNEVFDVNSSIERIENRINFLAKNPITRNTTLPKTESGFRIPIWKRTFDIVFAGLVLLMLLPLFIVIALLIRLESKGPIFYAAKRVGAAYKIFDFYKFRSMYQDADTRLGALMNEGQYQTTEEENIQLAISSANQSTTLYHDEGEIDEKDHLAQKAINEGKAFFKLANDPRITKVGRFIRNTSFDELPQLINVLKGDMSIVGNRPLPLYEAEKLTSDKWIKRFIAPAGLTGLWQVTKRGKSQNMSAEERKMLDVTYAQSYNFFGDLKIVFQTLPAMLQHENV